MFPVSVASACGALVGEALGRGDPLHATHLLHASCTFALVLVAVYTSLLGYSRVSVAELLSGGVPEVEAKYAAVLPLLLGMHLLDGIFNTLKQWLTLRRKHNPDPDPSPDTNTNHNPNPKP
jgi:Na+-driven multidrug efflux pump